MEIISGRLNLPGPGVIPQPLSTVPIRVKYLTVQAAISNTGNVSVGDASIATAPGVSGIGLQLIPGAIQRINDAEPIALNRVFACGANLQAQWLFWNAVTE